jgi:DNA polymerase (family 10)
VGPKKAQKLWQELAVDSVDALEEAAVAGRVAPLAGFGEKSQAKILVAIEEYREHQERTRLDEADRHVEPLVAYLSELPEVERIEVAGSYRRRVETVGDVDILVQAAPGPAAAAVMERFLAYPQNRRTQMGGPTRASVVLGSGLQVDLRVVPEESWGAALVYFTGSKEHNIELRQRALGRGLHLSEYGVFVHGREGDESAVGERTAGASEQDVYGALGLAFVPPEMREARGEVKRAAIGGDDELPRLIEVSDLRGDLQMHSTWSDGKASPEEMLEACVARGYEYFALTDHTKALAMTGGLHRDDVLRQWEEIDEVQERHPEIRFLKSLEVDILADGSLDMEDEILEGLDLVLVSVHSRFDLPAAEQTERILAAVRHPLTHVVAHPTGRIINRRRPFEFDLDRVLEACLEHRVAVELNANPARLDLKDTHLARARDLGVPVVISTDAHSPRHLGFMPYGVEQARRAWLTPDHVLNCRPLDELLAWLER